MGQSERQQGTLCPPKGNDRIARTLSGSIRSGNIHHAYLFEGPGGTGKAQMAQWFSALLLCEREVDPLAERSMLLMPCGSCPSCLGLSRGQHADLRILEAAEGKASISIGQVRELIRTVSFAPLRADRRAIWIREADTMGDVPANALLKTLEEPAPYNVFILITERGNQLLDTIRSRCQRIRFSPLPLRQVCEVLAASHSLSEGEARILGYASGGSVSLALELAEAGFLERHSEWFERYVDGPLAGNSAAGKVSTEASYLASEHRKQRNVKTGELALFLKLFKLLLRDALVSGTGAPDDQLTWPMNRARAEAVHERLGDRSVISFMDRLTKAEEALYRPLNVQLVVEDFLLRLDIGLTRRPKSPTQAIGRPGA
jgi:DNA polymerase III delta' subunit